MSVGPFCEICGDESKTHFQEEINIHICVGCYFCISYLLGSLSLNECEKIFDKIRDNHSIRI